MRSGGKWYICAGECSAMSGRGNGPYPTEPDIVLHVIKCCCVVKVQDCICHTFCVSFRLPLDCVSHVRTNCTYISWSMHLSNCLTEHTHIITVPNSLHFALSLFPHWFLSLCLCVAICLFFFLSLFASPLSLPICLSLSHTISLPIYVSLSICELRTLFDIYSFVGVTIRLYLFDCIYNIKIPTMENHYYHINLRWTSWEKSKDKIIWSSIHVYLYNMIHA